MHTELCQAVEHGNTTSPGQGQLLDLPDSHVMLYRSFLAPEAADCAFRVLRETVDWREGVVTIAGRAFPMPRLQSWHGDPGATYKYSGMWLEPRPWLPILDQLRTELGAVAGAQFNSVLANLYRDGRDSVSWHSDDEKHLGQEPVIASLSLGATRRFELAHRGDKALRFSLDLDHGSLLVMKGATQRYWKHQVPKQPSIRGTRINLTFRVVHIPCERPAP